MIILLIEVIVKHKFFIIKIISFDYCVFYFLIFKTNTIIIY